MQRQSITAGDSALDALRQADGEPIAVLHAGRFHRRWASRSLIGRPIGWYRYTATGGSALDWPAEAGAPPLSEAAMTHRPWRDLRALLRATAGRGRWVGYFSYDLAYQLESHMLGGGHRAERGCWPLIELGYCPAMAAHTPPMQRADEPLDALAAAAEVEAVLDRRDYEAAIQRVIEYIGSGDVFQVNLAQPFEGRFTGEPRALFRRLAMISPAWYGAYLELGGVERSTGGPRRALLSTSPELFLEARGRRVVTRPIKGTRPTGGDDSGRRELLGSEKDAAELNMIIDLLRNDLGRVCDYGSVRVVQPRTIETHPTVHHGVATIAGRLHASKDIVDLLRAALPGGSITGAPKIRAMQIIDELEPRPRGPYCGAIGWVTHNAACLNVAIRTMVLRASESAADGRGGDAEAPRNREAADAHARNRPDGPGQACGGASDAHAAASRDLEKAPYDVSFHVGGGIVADSAADAEYNETLDKARAMLRALGHEDPARLIRP